MDYGKVVKKIFESKLEGKRKLEDLDWDGWKMSQRICRRWKLKKWQQKAVDREEWAFVIKDVRGFKSTNSQSTSVRSMFILSLIFTGPSQTLHKSGYFSQHCA